jgi:hypothetical protein
MSIANDNAKCDCEIESRLGVFNLIVREPSKLNYNLSI